MKSKNEKPAKPQAPDNRAILTTNKRETIKSAQTTRQKVPLTRALWALLFILHSSFFILHCPAATVTNIIRDSAGNGLTSKILIEPLSPVTRIGNDLIVTTNISYIATNGAVSNVLVTGDYRYTINNRDRFVVAVPDTTNFVSLSSIITNLLTYTRTSSPTYLDRSGDAMGGALTFFSWATSGRPGSPTNGMTGYNTDNAALEVYAGGIWSTIGASSSGGGTNQYGFVVVTNYADIQSAATSNTHAFRLQEANLYSNANSMANIPQNFTLFATFDGTNGVGSNLVQKPLVGTFAGIFGENGSVGGSANFLLRTNGHISLAKQSNALEAFYYFMTATSTNSLKRVVANFDVEQEQGTNYNPHLGLIISSNAANYNSAGFGSVAHIFWRPHYQALVCDFYTNGYNNGLLGSVSMTWGFSENYGTNLTLEYSIDGDNIYACYRGVWQKTNVSGLSGLVLGNNLCVEYIDLLPWSSNSAPGRWFLDSVAASSTPSIPANAANFLASSNGIANSPTFNGTSTFNTNILRVTGSQLLAGTNASVWGAEADLPLLTNPNNNTFAVRAATNRYITLLAGITGNGFVFPTNTSLIFYPESSPGAENYFPAMYLNSTGLLTVAGGIKLPFASTNLGVDSSGNIVAVAGGGSTLNFSTNFSTNAASKIELGTNISVNSILANTANIGTNNVGAVQFTGNGLYSFMLNAGLNAWATNGGVSTNYGTNFGGAYVVAGLTITNGSTNLGVTVLTGGMNYNLTGGTNLLLQGGRITSVLTNAGTLDNTNGTINGGMASNLVVSGYSVQRSITTFTNIYQVSQTIANAAFANTNNTTNIVSIAFTPKLANSTIIARANIGLGTDAGVDNFIFTCLFRDNNTNSIARTQTTITANQGGVGTLVYSEPSSNTTVRTYSIRVANGNSQTNMMVNQPRLSYVNTVFTSSFEIEELAP